MRPATLVGRVVSVTGTTVQVRIHADQPSLALVNGESHRVGQVGAFLRIPIGYRNLYGICIQVGAAAAPLSTLDATVPLTPMSQSEDERVDGRWLTMTLFGESVAKEFQRGIGTYPTVGDEVHLTQADEVETIFTADPNAITVEIGTVASTTTLPAVLDLPKLVTRHSAVLGSTGSGKSNFVAALLESIASSNLPSARVLVIDAHGEYGSALSSIAEVFSITPVAGAKPLYVPFWALPFDELVEATTGSMSDGNLAELRTEVESRKRATAAHLPSPVPAEAVSADSPIPFSLKSVWHALHCREAQTYDDNQGTRPTTPLDPGDVDKLLAPTYPPHVAGGRDPYAPRPRGIGRQVALMRNRLKDTRFNFLFDPGPELTPATADGRTPGDLDALIASWVGHDKPVTVLDMSGAPSEVLPLVTGALLRLVYDALFWAGDLSVSGRVQPLLVVLEEAHLFAKSGGDTIANRAVAAIAKEGRKYGVGLMLVTQRPSDLDRDALSQCGTVVALRMTNNADRAHVAAALPDELTLLAEQLPGLRTGEAIISGEAIIAPTRVRIRRASRRLAGTDAPVHAGWAAPRPNSAEYSTAIARWRATNPAAEAAPTTPTPISPGPAPAPVATKENTDA
jgi:hypothetical protein